MVGDRILFKVTNKDLKIENGEFASLVSVDKNKFVAKTDNGREIAFNPEKISFKHGYASTVYKAQGASIKDTYVLHNMAGNSRNSYVAMTRHVEEVKLYCNREATKNMTNLISQLSQVDHRMTSMLLYTQEDLVKAQKQEKPKLVDKIGSWFKLVANDIQDRFFSNQEYYQLTITAQPLVKVVEVLEKTVANNNINSKEEIMATKNFNYKQELTELKQRLPFHSADIAVSLLGKPNKYLSNNYILRWQEDGKIAMKIKGNKAGIWYDFSKGEGGDLFTLVQKEKNYNFNQAKQYLQEMVGVSNYLTPETSQINHQNQKEQCYEEAKIKRTQNLYNKSSSVTYSTENSVTKTYLNEYRGIKTVLDKLQLSQDLRTNMMWDSQTKQYYPALVAFARDKDGKITGGQSIYLNKETGAKADIKVNKRSFGKISGSFINIQQEQKGQNNVTIIAEGLETALSLQEAGIKGKILCSLGVNNIKNYQLSVGEKILIAADNDGKDSVSLNTLTKYKEEIINHFHLRDESLSTATRSR